MPYDRSHIHVTWGGPLASVEEWSTGIRYAKMDPGVAGPNATHEDFLALPVSSLWTPVLAWFNSGNGGSGIGALAQLSWLKAALIKTDGHYAEDAKFVSFAPITPGVTTQLSPQDCYVVSLRSGQSLGDANYGRMYVPTPTWGVGQNGGLITEVQAAGARTAARTMINALTGVFRTNSNDAFRPVIMSTKGTGKTKEITQIGVGRVMDTQRRRRNKLNEATALVAL